MSALTAATSVFASAISFYEIGQKVRIGKWPEMAAYVPNLPRLLTDSGVAIRPVDGPVAIDAATLAWEHPDPFDRLIVATALRDRLTVVTSDRAFAAMVPVVW
jgi:PIN domain nuclease of toxin-antitoxin system